MRKMIVVSGLLGAWLAVGPCAAQTTPGNADATASRLANVERLIESSSGARQVEASGVQAAMDKRERARALFRDAQSRHQAGDQAAADDLMKQASKEMFEAVRLAGAPAALEEKRQHDLDERIESVGVLTKALERIGKEKGQGARAQAAVKRAEALIAEAESMRRAGDAQGARKRADEAYDVAKREIEDLRGGDTLVRSLTFATPEEEYRYEVDRNETHRMLVTVLLEEKRASKGVDRMVQGFLDRARQLREEAEGLAGRGDFRGAIGTLERSTKELVRAIRGAGVYIPG
ncbi:MAG: hypothetical protein H6983_10545 [Ectothiorhodospiraceae bacterium]|nr:hypothetical protein [Chromatiales bacterium]MCP5154595.1 hypothetical protein [Ectothiorhodospiraceae bacterium]